MGVRLVITFTAAAGRGGELAQAFAARCAEVTAQEHGCEQYEIFQSAVNPDRLILMELWTTQADLDAHAELNKTRSPLPRELFAGVTEREDYVYNRTR
jgi:quinol monooxygenase YgiN